MPVQVERLTEKNDAELSEFLDGLGRRSASVLCYHYPIYRDVIAAAGAGEPCTLAARFEGKLRAVLPAFRKTTAEGCVFSSLPFFGPNAGVLVGDDGHELRTVLLRAFVDDARDADALACSVYTPFLDQDFLPYDTAMPDAFVADKFTQYLDLETVTYNKSIAYDLRRGERIGVRISTDVDAHRRDAFYSLYAQNCLEQGIPVKPRACVDLLLGDGIIGKFSDVYFAFQNDVMIAGLLVLRSPMTVSYYIPCTLASARGAQPGTLLIDRAITDARARGARYWNWESSPSRESGVYHFKKKWGSLEAAYRIYVQPFRSEMYFRELGRERIAELFPYYFVYPFDRLRGDSAALPSVESLNGTRKEE